MDSLAKQEPALNDITRSSPIEFSRRAALEWSAPILFYLCLIEVLK